MDITTLATLIGIVIVGIMALVGSVFGGMIGAIILSTIAILGLALLPAIPIIPIWIAILIVAIEVLFIAYKIAEAFGIGRGGSAA